MASTVYGLVKVGFHADSNYEDTKIYYSLKLVNAVVFMLLTVALSAILVVKKQNLLVS